MTAGLSILDLQSSILIAQHSALSPQYYLIVLILGQLITAPRLMGFFVLGTAGLGIFVASSGLLGGCRESPVAVEGPTDGHLKPDLG